MRRVSQLPDGPPVCGSTGPRLPGCNSGAASAPLWPDVLPRYCKDCGQKLEVFRLNRKTLMFVCDKFGCPSWRNPQGYLVIRGRPTGEQVIIDEQLEGTGSEEDEERLKKLRDKLILRDKRDPRSGIMKGGKHND